MKIKSFATLGQIFLGMGFFLGANQAFAHSYENCRTLDESSCWHGVNDTDKKISIKCNESEFKTELDAGKLYSYQYCSGWADGMGYPAPATFFMCEVSMKEPSKFVAVSFSTIGYGDRVGIRVTNQGVSVTLKEYWGSQIKTVQKNWN